MKLKAALLFFALSILTPSSEKKNESIANININDLEHIRLNYYASVEKEELVTELEKFINKKFTSDRSKYPTLILAYVAALQSVKSKHAFWPTEKYSYFKKSMSLFDEVMLKDPKNLEIRFLRFAILHYVPSFLGYSAERSEDARIIVAELIKQDFSSIKPEIQKGIAEFMVQSERLNNLEILKLRRTFALNE